MTSPPSSSNEFPSEPSNSRDTDEPIRSAASGAYSICQITRKAMATEFVILLPSQDASAPSPDPSVDSCSVDSDQEREHDDRPGKAVEAAVEAADLLEGIEADLTIYRPTSEISRINLLASESAVSISKPTFDLLQRAVYWGEQTGGAFDITAAPLVEAWGFTKRSGKKPTAAEIENARRVVGYQHLNLNPSNQTVGFAIPGMAINLGGIGKGDALDRLANHLRNRGVNDFLIHGGNSSVIASGDQTPGSGQGWAVGLAHPTKSNRRLAGIWLRNQALATSGSGKQFFHHQGRRYGHVIDPRTGYPAGDLLSLTLLMDNATDADALATGWFVSGSDVVRDQFQQTNLAAAMLVHRGDRQDSAKIETLGEFHWIDPPAESDLV
ncbi:FAD:protein FMN transferase [Novipirellula sp. SH528]|uniref:FAD:protein FMN transferase n=1 Tax=Novipirellula sp. SH528 TaxID=3454466 RepID=UPI003FA03E0C